VPYAFGAGAGISSKDNKGSNHERKESTGSFWSPDMAQRDSTGSAFRPITPVSAAHLGNRESGADSPEDMFRAPSFVFSHQRPIYEPFADLISHIDADGPNRRESSVRWSQPSLHEGSAPARSTEAHVVDMAAPAAAGAAACGMAGAMAGGGADKSTDREKERDSTLTMASSSESTQSSGGTVRAAIKSLDSTHLDPFIDSYKEEETADPYRRSDLTIAARRESVTSEATLSYQSAHTSYSARSDDASVLTVDRINAMDFGELDANHRSAQRDTMDTDTAFAYDGLDGKRASDPFRD
jgi:hypothetical protein